jgi:glycosyltransferase involved in cell wall biosynthesis
MIKIFDCSNSNSRHQDHRGFGGPVENTIVTDLKKYAYDYNFVFVDNILNADVVFTNDIFTPESIASGLPLVKRMDGIFFQDTLLKRNDKLNDAARQADLVIFISEFSKEALHILYQITLLKETVILNWVEQSTFAYNHRTGIPKIFIASATSWRRAEKRLNGILSLAIANPNKQFRLIGKLDKIQLPNNVVSLGYLHNDVDIASALCNADAMICTAFRDAAPKTVAQGLATGLPVFYADSGGVAELVGGNGLGFTDNNKHTFYSETPNIQIDQMIKAFDIFCNTQYNVSYDPLRYQNVISSYFSEISKLIR